MGYTRKLAEYAVNLRYEDLPEGVKEQAVRLITQIVGISIAGCDTREACVLNHLSCQEEGSSETFGLGGGYSEAFAAYINGTLADVLDWEDCAWTGHPSAGIVPVAWVLGQKIKADGRQLITAVTAAYDVYQRIAMSLQPTPEEKKKNGWGLMSWQIFGAVAAGAKILGFSAEETDRALTLAADTAVLPTAMHDFTMSNGYHFEHGMRCYTAVNILEFVRSEEGKNLETGGLDIYEKFAVHYTSQWKPEWLLKDLGTRYSIMDTMLKYYPGNMWSLPPIDAVMSIRELHNGVICPEDIRKITVIPGTAGRMRIPDENCTITDIVLNVPFGIANAVYNPDFGSYWYAEENVHDPKMLSLAAKVCASDDPADSSASGFALFLQGDYPLKKVSVELNDGRVFTGVSKYPAGHPRNRWSLKEAEDLYIRSAGKNQGEKAEETAEMLVSLAQCGDISKISTYIPVKTVECGPKAKSLHNNRHKPETRYTQRIASYIADAKDKQAAAQETGRRLGSVLGECGYYDALLIQEVLENCGSMNAMADDINTAIGFAATCSINPRKPKNKAVDHFLDSQIRKEAAIIAETAVKGIYHFMDALDDRIAYADRISPQADLGAAFEDLMSNGETEI